MTEPSPLPPVPYSRPQRSWLHLLLFVLTLGTMALVSPMTWEGLAYLTLESRGLPGLQHWLETARIGLPFALYSALILLCHEMGHYLACRYYRVPASLPYFIPLPVGFGTLGAVIRIRGRIPHRRALFDIAAAGPIAGFVVTLVVLWIGLADAQVLDAVPEEYGGPFFGKPPIRHVIHRLLGTPEWIQVNGVYGAAWFGFLITALNLCPVGQLDGGHAAYAWSRGLHRFSSWATIVGLVGLIAYQLWTRQPPAYLIWLVLLVWMRSRHPRLADEGGELGPGRKLVALLLLVIFALSFIAFPIYVRGGMW